MSNPGSCQGNCCCRCLNVKRQIVAQCLSDTQPAGSATAATPTTSQPPAPTADARSTPYAIPPSPEHLEVHPHEG